MIAALVAMLGSMTVLAVEPVREKLYKMVETLFTDHTNVNFQEVGEETAEDETDSEARSFNPADFPRKLKWVPEGFSLSQENKYTDLYICNQFFENIDSQGVCHQIDYEQALIENSGGWTITSDGTPAEEIVIGKEKGKLITDEGGYHSIIVVKGGFIYYIGGNVDVEILVKCLATAVEEK